jgi:hypothetical protein
MANLISSVGKKLIEAPAAEAEDASALLKGLLEKEAYVGDVVSLSYNEAIVQIHDFYRKQVGGIPALSFLLATRITAGGTVKVDEEEASLILLRVIDHADLPNAEEARRVRVENAQRVSGELDVNWDDRSVMDASTHNILSYAGIRCRVIGTFYLNNFGGDEQPLWRLCFGSDISNYYPNRGLKVYKPRGEILETIVNFRDPFIYGISEVPLVSIGHVRYASTNRPFQQISNVNVAITPTDLLSQKTALFGMTRSGKSNTTKIILKSIFALRWEKETRVGQLVFDPNGEYANENVQDQSKGTENPNAIKNVAHCAPQSRRKEFESDVITYGIAPHPNDPNRILMLLNFYLDDNLQNGKEIIDSFLAGDSNTKFISNFRDVRFESPDPSDRSASTRHQRRVLFYRALLSKAGFAAPGSVKPFTKGLFNKEIMTALANSGSASATDYANCATMLAKPTPTWGEIAQAGSILREFIKDNASGFAQFDATYVQTSSSGSWADDDLRKVLEMFAYPNGSRQIGKVADRHTPSTSSDYAADIYEHC